MKNALNLSRWIFGSVFMVLFLLTGFFSIVTSRHDFNLANLVWSMPFVILFFWLGLLCLPIRFARTTWLFLLGGTVAITSALPVLLYYENYGKRCLVGEPGPFLILPCLLATIIAVCLGRRLK